MLERDPGVEEEQSKIGLDWLLVIKCRRRVGSGFPGQLAAFKLLEKAGEVLYRDKCFGLRELRKPAPRGNIFLFAGKKAFYFERVEYYFLAVASLGLESIVFKLLGFGPLRHGWSFLRQLEIEVRGEEVVVEGAVPLALQFSLLTGSFEALFEVVHYFLRKHHLARLLLQVGSLRELD